MPLFCLIIVASGVPSYPIHPGVGAIYKGADSATIIQGPDGSIVKAEVGGGTVGVAAQPAPVVEIIKDARLVAVEQPVVTQVKTTAVTINKAGTISATSAAPPFLVANPIATPTIVARQQSLLQEALAKIRAQEQAEAELRTQQRVEITLKARDQAFAELQAQEQAAAELRAQQQAVAEGETRKKVIAEIRGQEQASAELRAQQRLEEHVRKETTLKEGLAGLSVLASPKVVTGGNLFLANTPQILATPILPATASVEISNGLTAVKSFTTGELHSAKIIN